MTLCVQAEEERDGMEKVKLDNRRILFNLLPVHVAQHFLMSNPRNMVRDNKVLQIHMLHIGLAFLDPSIWIGIFFVLN